MWKICIILCCRTCFCSFLSGWDLPPAELWAGPDPQVGNCHQKPLKPSSFLFPDPGPPPAQPEAVPPVPVAPPAAPSARVPDN